MMDIKPLQYLPIQLIKSDSVCLLKLLKLCKPLPLILCNLFIFHICVILFFYTECVLHDFMFLWECEGLIGHQYKISLSGKKKNNADTRGDKLWE